MIRKSQKILSATPNLASFATPYSTGDVLGGVVKISGAVADSGAVATLISLTVLDKAGIAKDLDLYIFDTAPASSVGADNSAWALADSDLPYLLGSVHVASTDYTSSSNNSMACKANIQLLIQAAKPALPATGQNKRDIWVVAVARASATYTSASDLTFRLGIDQT